MTHKIADLHFERRTNGGTVTCECSWTVAAPDLYVAFAEHRKASGVTGAHDSHSLGPRTTTPDQWNGGVYRECRIEGCAKPAQPGGLCHGHISRRKRKQEMGALGDRPGPQTGRKVALA